MFITYSVPISPELKNLINRLLEKDPNGRITIEEIRSHPWITKFDGFVPSTDTNCTNSIDVSEKDIEGAFQHHRTPIHILVRDCHSSLASLLLYGFLYLQVMIKRMAKQKSLKNPYADDSPINSPDISSARLNLLSL